MFILLFELLLIVLIAVTIPIHFSAEEYYFESHIGKRCSLLRSSSTLKSGKDVFPCNHFFVKMHIKTFLFLFPRLSELPSIMDARVYKMIGVQLPPIQIITVFLTNSNTLNGCPKPWNLLPRYSSSYLWVSRMFAIPL